MSLLFWDPITPVIIKEPNFRTAFPTIRPDLRGQPPLSFSVILVPISRQWLPGPKDAGSSRLQKDTKPFRDNENIHYLAVVVVMTQVHACVKAH